MRASIFFLLAIAVPAFGHSKFETLAEQRFRAAHFKRSQDAMRSCAHKLQARDAVHQRYSERDAFIDEHLQSIGLDPKSFLPKRDSIVEGSNSSCILTPEGEEGPYYVNGSLIRRDVRESQDGFPLLLDIQITDVNTCEPIEGVMVDFWSANSTGVYSGKEAENTLGETWLRGIRRSSRNGIVQVLTNVPGWYQGRAQHIHVKAHVNYTRYDNDTISFGDIVHTGQIFFSQDTLSIINSAYPYTLDTNTLTLNTDDNVIQDQQNTSYYDAFVELRSLGWNLTAGFVGFINIAIDPNSTPAAVGGNANGGGGTVGNGTMMGNSTMSLNGTFTMSGSAPSGSISPSGTLTGSALTSTTTTT